MCDRGLTLRHCQRHWRQVLAGVPVLVSKKVGSYARHLAEYWRSRHLLEAVAQATPGFAVSIALHAAAFILTEWRGGLHEPYFAFQHAATYLKLYREHVGRVDLKDMTSQAGGLRLADLDEAISILVQQSFPTSLDVAQRERIIDVQTRHPRALVTAITHAAFQGSLAEAIEALDIVHLDYVPSQGTLISLLRYGDFPAGRLSNSKRMPHFLCAVSGLGRLTGHGSDVPKMAAAAGAAVGTEHSDRQLQNHFQLAACLGIAGLNAALKICSCASQWQSALQQRGMAACAGIQENAATRTTLTSILRDAQRWQRVLRHFSQLQGSVSFDEIELRAVVGAVSRERSAWTVVNALLCTLRQDLLEPSGGLISSVLVNRDCWQVAILLSRSTNLILRTAVVGLCARTGQWTRSVSHVRQMHDMKLSPNVMAFRPDMMTGAILLTGEGRLAWISAMRLFSSMRSRGVASISLLSLRCAALARWRITCSLLGKRWARDISEELAGQLVDLCAEASWRLGAAMVVEAASFSLRPNLMTSTPLLAAAGRTGDWKMSLAFLAEASDTVDSVASCAAATACTTSACWSSALGLLCSVPCARLPLDTAGESTNAMALEAGSAWQRLIQQIGQAAWLRGDIGFCCSVSGACEKASKWAMALWMAANFHWLRVSERIACNSCLTSCRRSGCWELTLQNWIGFGDGFQDLLTLALGIDVFDKCGRVGEVAGACETLQTFVFGRLLATLGKGIAF
ncbi:unnamed protein product [Symbiodinium sp. KB8]|nr:unnamed protein product [Symbiodinium sp. KB8]